MTTQNSTHTPGPWRTDAGVILSEDGRGIAVAQGPSRVFQPRRFAPEHERLPNAKLIAAAPTLLEALEEIAGHSGNLYANPDDDWADVAMLLKKRARAAIEAAS